MGFVKETYKALNHSNPNTTQSCWLSTPYIHLTAGHGCKCHLQLIHSVQPTAVLLGRPQGGPYHERVWGWGTCLGTIPTDKQTLCAQTGDDTNFANKTYDHTRHRGMVECAHRLG